MTLKDSFDRAFRYLRLSVEDACNFRCVYCLPEGYKKTQQAPPLSRDEVGRLLRAFAELGLWKVRLTGGEPTLRQDIVELVETAVATPGVRAVALSTNGHRLRELAPRLKSAGLSSINISVDSLDPGRFEELTGRRLLAEILSGVEDCLSLGLKTKLNAVLLAGLNDGELGSFLDYARNRPVEVRFIELMRNGATLPIFEQRHLSAKAVLDLLAERGFSEEPRGPADGPARRFSHRDFHGKIGVIAPYSPDFCSTCNRLRVTSRGGLRLCLFAEEDFDLRPLLQEDGQREALKTRVRELLGRKEPSHYLPEGRYGGAKNFAVMGG